MPRRSSSQSHRLVELFKEAERGQAPPPPAAVEPTPEPTPPPTPQEPEEQGFDYNKWAMQCRATRLAIPRGSLRSRQGKKHAEAIYSYLCTQDFEKIERHLGQGIWNGYPSPQERNRYNEALYKSRLIV